jgi:hypothetical protein
VDDFRVSVLRKRTLKWTEGGLEVADGKDVEGLVSSLAPVSDPQLTAAHATHTKSRAREIDASPRAERFEFIPFETRSQRFRVPCPDGH